MTTLDPSELDKLHLSIDSHVVVQLGSELVTDAAQALLELVKNAYDSDSTYCSVVIDTKYQEPTPDIDVDAAAGFAPKDNSASKAQATKPMLGKITVKDGGDGMTLSDIERGWLVISASIKRPEDGAKAKTKKYHRVPLGDKGLGRLSTMKLGDKLTIRTFTKEADQGIQVSFRWSSFRSGTSLESVALEKKLVPKGLNSEGTEIEIVGLDSLDVWRQPSQHRSLRRSLSTLVTPFESLDKFLVTLQFDDVGDVIEKLQPEDLQKSAAEFDASWRSGHGNEGEEGVEQSHLKITAKVKLGIFNSGNSKAKKRDVDSRILADRGIALFAYLKTHKETKGYKLTRDAHDGSLNYGETLQKSTIPTDRQFSFWGDPGIFDTKLYYFLLPDLDRPDVQEQPVAGKASLKELVKAMAGVSIFRDGFKIRCEGDWLGISAGTTSGTSFYGLRASNVLGYVKISGEHNAKLQETSSRENFIDNPEFRGFMVLNRRLVKVANDLLGAIRRAAADFLDRKDTSAPAQPLPADEELSELARAAEEVSSSRGQLLAIQSEASSRLQKVMHEIGDAKRDLLIDEKTSALLSKVNDQLYNFSRELGEIPASLADARQNLANATGLSTRVSEQLQTLQSRMESLFESAAIGLAARGLAHELASYLDELSANIKRLRDDLSLKTRSNPEQSRQYLAAMEASLRGIRGYLAIIDPMLPRQRGKRESISLHKFVEEYFAARVDRFNRDGIDVQFVSKASAPVVFLNRGHLLQVIDNLVRNSEYWLKVKKPLKNDNGRKIVVEYQPWGVEFSDSGPGIREVLEDTLFDLFVSDKPETDHSGLGLYISRTLVEGAGGTLTLSDERNEQGRRFKFVLHLPTGGKK